MSSRGEFRPYGKGELEGMRQAADKQAAKVEQQVKQTDPQVCPQPQQQHNQIPTVKTIKTFTWSCFCRHVFKPPPTLLKLISQAVLFMLDVLGVL